MSPEEWASLTPAERQRHGRLFRVILAALPADANVMLSDVTADAVVQSAVADLGAEQEQ